MQNISAVVILYNPLPIVKYNILSYIDYIDCLYIIDNSYQYSTLLLSGFVSNKIKVLHYGSNIGISKALNIALKQAKEDNYKWLLTFDQDTYFIKKDDCLHFLSNIYMLDDTNIALISPLHNKKFINIIGTRYEQVDFVMTSANCINIDITMQIGGFDEKLFIDEVDHEFCLRLKRYKYIILKDNHIAVNHSLGISHKWFSKIKIYDSLRLYYMIRNYLYIRRIYKVYNIDFFKKRDRYLIKFFILQTSFSKNIFKDISYIIKGIKDYRSNKFGKLENNV